MPSPFPGMDPYIEDPELWPDFHNDLASEIRAELNKTIQPKLLLRQKLAENVDVILIEIKYKSNRRMVDLADDDITS